MHISLKKCAFCNVWFAFYSLTDSENQIAVFATYNEGLFPPILEKRDKACYLLFQEFHFRDNLYTPSAVSFLMQRNNSTTIFYKAVQGLLYEHKLFNKEDFIFLHIVYSLIVIFNAANILIYFNICKFIVYFNIILTFTCMFC